MNLSHLSIIGVLAGLLCSFSAIPTTAAAPTYLFEEVPFSEWVIAEGDSFLVDTKENMGYLVHTDGVYTKFEVATGQRRNVYYIGRYYNAKTPDWEWVAKTREIKGDRVTFGPTGRFFRLFKGGDERTAYGIHEYKYEDKMFSLDERFGSMGCIIVRSAMLDIIQDTFYLNGGTLNVTTQYGLDNSLFVMR